MLKYKPDEFRNMSVAEFFLALDGVAISNGTYKQRSNKVTWNDIIELEARANANHKRASC